MKPRIDLTGQRVNRWTVLGPSKVRRGPHPHWDCRCDCGTKRAVAQPSLRSGISLSCGCAKRERTIARKTTHNMTGHPAYSSWTAMKKRCTNAKSSNYAYYGGRGITVSDDWLQFENFWRDMGPTWKPGLTIERRDNDAGYSRENCCWATMAVQNANKRNTPRRRHANPWPASP